MAGRRHDHQADLVWRVRGRVRRRNERHVDPAAGRHDDGRPNRRGSKSVIATREPGGAATSATNPPGPTAILPGSSRRSSPRSGGSRHHRSACRVVSSGATLVHARSSTGGTTSAPPSRPGCGRPNGPCWSTISSSPTRPTASAPPRVAISEVPVPSSRPGSDGMSRPAWTTTGSPSTPPPGSRPLYGLSGRAGKCGRGRAAPDGDVLRLRARACRAGGPHRSTVDGRRARSGSSTATVPTILAAVTTDAAMGSDTAPPAGQRGNHQSGHRTDERQAASGHRAARRRPGRPRRHRRQARAHRPARGGFGRSPTVPAWR